MLISHPKKLRQNEVRSGRLRTPWRVDVLPIIT